MKKSFLFVLLLVSLFFVNINVNAEVGVRYVTVLDAQDSSYSVVQDGKAATTLDGIKYLEESNTLVLKDCDYSQIYIEEMGEGFTIQLDGVNKLTYLVILGTNVTISGEGTLIVDSTKDLNNPKPASIYMQGNTRDQQFSLKITNEATVKVYSNLNTISYMGSKDDKTVRLIFENGMDVTDQLVFKSHLSGPNFESDIGDYALPLKELVIEPKKEEPKQEVDNPYTGNGMMLVIDAIILLGVLGFAIKTMKKA